MNTTFPSRWRNALALFLLVVILNPVHAQDGVGERWKATRGDGSPGVRYTSFVETPNGRWLAAGPDGQLMLSDNDGSDWRYQVITDGQGQPIFGTISDMVVNGGQIVATLLSVRESVAGESQLPFVGRTQILTSADNGDTWSVSAFPINTALFNGVPFPGVYLTSLFLAPNGQLLAYGTTLQADGPIGYFIGGAIFRQQGGVWEQAHFAFGALSSMNLGDNGRLVTSGFQTVLDSADGAGWNGYSLSDANMMLNGELLSFEESEALFGSDIAFIDNNYVMQTQQFRKDEASGVFIVGNERSVIFQSPNPFDGGRIWNGVEASRVYPNWIPVGGALVSVFDRAFRSTNGVGWTEIDDTVSPLAFSTGRVNGNDLVAVGSSDDVWQSVDAGEGWSKILDQGPGPNLSVIASINGVLLARDGGGFGTPLYRSVDNGNTWVESTNIRDETGRSGLTLPRNRGSQLFAAQGVASQIITSNDQGLTWQTIAVPGNSSDALSDVVIGQNGRLIVAPEGRGIGDNPSIFYTSDDDGQTWVPRDAPIGFSETPKRGLHVGGGRIVYLINSASSFDPELIVSDNNGETWRRESPFQSVEGLNTIANEPGTKVINLQNLVQTEAGTLIIVGGDSELIYSHDLGETWSFGLNLEAEEEGFQRWELPSVVESGGRLVAIVYRDTPTSSAFRLNFAFISEDEGATWRRIPIPVEQGNTALASAVVGADGRLIVGGTNGAIFVSDLEQLDPQEPTRFTVREGESLTVGVPRPPMEGEVILTYVLRSGTATAGSDFTQTMGQLTWMADDTAPQSVVVDTIDDPQAEEPEILQVEFAMTGELIVRFSYNVTITDNEAIFERGVAIVSDGVITTSEDGASDTFGAALSRDPTDNVTLTLSTDSPTEVSFSPTTLEFTPANWNVAQSVTVTGLDDSVRDRNRTVQILFTPTSNDTNYQDAEPGIAYVINQDNEKEELVFASGFEP
ncbi:MAG: Calx-beta domain-containing protein [Lysobacterales bacterium]